MVLARKNHALCSRSCSGEMLSAFATGTFDSPEGTRIRSTRGKLRLDPIALDHLTENALFASARSTDIRGRVTKRPASLASIAFAILSPLRHAALKALQWPAAPSLPGSAGQERRRRCTEFAAEQAGLAEVDFQAFVRRIFADQLGCFNSRWRLPWC